ncbi:MAG: hypothetical protein RLZZ501_1652 [Pseudomonadota bacterium]
MTHHGTAEPVSPQIHQRLVEALALHKAGRLDEAVWIYRAVLTAAPTNFDALHLLGAALAQAGRRGEAESYLRAAVALSPDHPAARNNFGNLLKDMGRFDESLAQYDRAVALAPGEASAHSNRGNVLREMGRRTEALDSYGRAIAAQPDYADAHYNRGVVLTELERPEEALACYDRAIALNPLKTEAYYNRGNVLRLLGRLEDALASYDRALALNPRGEKILSNRGNILAELDRLDEALDDFNRAIAIKPDYPAPYSNRANILKEFRRFDEALASFDHAIALDPDFVDAHWNRALCLLQTGALARGWADYEWRRRKATWKTTRRSFEQPCWLGQSDPAGRTILVHVEQGFGDTIQFCRYLPLLAARGARVVVEAERQLLGLLGGLPGIEQLVAKGDPLPPFDYFCPMMSLALAFGTDLGSIPAAPRYLAADPTRVAQWRQRLGEARRPRIGVAWSGSRLHRNDRHRSIPLDSFARLFAADADFIALQKDFRPGDAERIAALPGLRAPGAELVDFSDTAALCELVDLVICVDTSVVHLAGALGRPVWLLLPGINPDWRWLLDRPDSPWYPSLRLYRQELYQGWPALLERVAADLDRVLAGGGRG